MGRLIDADKLEAMTYDDAYSSKCVSMHDIDAEPTAFDLNKVVEQMKERTAFLKGCTKYGNKTAKQQAKSYDTMMMYEIKNLVDDLIEIVKGGGVNGN